MRLSTIMTYVAGVGLVVLGVVMVKTNPTQAEYEEYAMQRLTKYLKSDVCKKTPKMLENLIKLDCDKVVDSASPQVRELVAATTERQDFIIFSIYRTDLKLNSWLPSYTFESVGVLESFYTYSAEQQ
ncbi:MAG: DUF4359 domain-containing protein [Hassallia sp.]